MPLFGWKLLCNKYQDEFAGVSMKRTVFNKYKIDFSLEYCDGMAEMVIKTRKEEKIGSDKVIFLLFFLYNFANEKLIYKRNIISEIKNNT